MIFGNLSIIHTIIIAEIILFLIIFAFVFKWLVKQVREICKNLSGYVILSQLTFIVFSWVVFLVILVYYMIFRPNTQVDVLTIFLTVTVGFLGTIMGFFFSERAFEKIMKERQFRMKVTTKKALERLDKLEKLE